MNLTLTSPELTSLNQQSEGLKAKAHGCKTDVNILHQRIQRVAAGVEDAQEDQENKESNIATILAGGDIDFKPDLRAQLATAMKKWRAVDDAQEGVSKSIYKAKREAATKVIAGVKKPHDAIMQRLCGSLVESCDAYAELFAMKRQLIDNEIGIFGGVCELMPDEFLGALNKYSNFAEFMRAAVKAGYIRKIPAGLAS